MKVTQTVPLHIGPEQGAKNQRTGKFTDLLTTMIEAQAEDTILVAPGVYKPIAFTIKSAQTPLTIKSLVPGQKFTLDAGGYQWKVFELLTGVSLTLEDAILTGNKMQYAHDAGVHTHFGKYDLILRRCVLHWLNNGILIGQHPEATVLLEDTELYDNGDHLGQTHNAYVGTVANFTMRRCYSHMVKNWGDPLVADWGVSYGHLVKTRAKKTVIEDCRLTMENGGANRCIDIPNGGDVEIRRCMLEYKSYSNKGQGQLISYGVEEGRFNNFYANHPLHRLIVEDSILVNRGSDIATTLWLYDVTAPTEYRWKNNIFSGVNMPSTVHTDAKWAIPLTPASGNRVVKLTDFVDVDNYDWRLK